MWENSSAIPYVPKAMEMRNTACQPSPASPARSSAEKSPMERTSCSATRYTQTNALRLSTADAAAIPTESSIVSRKPPIKSSSFANTPFSFIANRLPISVSKS